MEQRLYRHTRTRSLPLQHRGVVSLRIRLSSSRISTWLSRWFGQVTRMRPIAVIACAYSGAVRCAGVHKHGMSNDKLCKRYLFNLEMIVKDKAAANKKIEGPPRMLYLRELYASIHQIFKEQVLAVVRSSPDGCCPPLPRRPPTHPPPPPTRALLPTPTCCRALRATTGDARSHTYLLPAGPLPAPPTSLPPPHMHRAPARLHGHRTKCTGTAPNSSRTYPCAPTILRPAPA